MQLNNIINCLIIIFISEGRQKDFRDEVQSFDEIHYLEFIQDRERVRDFR